MTNPPGARKLKGRCACGAVEYEVADEFLYAANCHCSACRAMTGSAFKSFAGIERGKLTIAKGADAVAIYGEPDAGDVRCATCHSFLFSIVRDGAFVHVAMGSLVDAPSIRPHEHTSSAPRRRGSRSRTTSRSSTGTRASGAHEGGEDARRRAGDRRRARAAARGVAAPRVGRLGIAPVASAGTSNALYRLGSDLVVRLPRIEGATGQIAAERRWLPWLAPQVPLAIPEPLAEGAPGAGFPWPWAVHRWIEGEAAAHELVADLGEAATALGRFVAALQRIDPGDGPPPEERGSSRGAPLATRDVAVREAIAALGGTLAAEAPTAAWDAALRTPEWGGRPVWLHGDLYEGNLLARDGRITAVIDFGCLGVGDPACDLMVAWTYLTADTREAFRAELEIADDATWARGRAWALSMGLIALPYYLHSNPSFARTARRMIAEALADQPGTPVAA